MSEVSSVPSRPTSPASNGTPDLLPTARPYRFTWDPASRRPGPESVSGFTEGPGADDFSGPHPLAFLNTSNTSLALGSLPSEWSSSRTGFHAISTVLNNPHKRQAPPKAHSTLPSVSVAELPRVRRKDFESYLKAVTPEWERYEHNTQLGREGLEQIDASQGTPRNSFSADDPPTPVPPSLQGKHIPPLDSVPSVFFQRNFSLGDPKTFADVTEQDMAGSFMSPQDDSFENPFSLSRSLPLLEKFSHYADTVEQHLVREIFIRSTSFFAALTNLHDLQSESERCLDRITKLRKELQDVDNNGAKRGLEMVRKESKMANLGKVRDGVKLISEVVEMTGVAKSLVNAGQWGQALGVIEDVEKLYETNEAPSPDTATTQPPPRPGRANPRLNGNGHPPGVHLRVLDEEDSEDITGRSPATPLTSNPTPKLHPQRSVALSSLHAFASLPSHLRQLTMEIAASLSNELVSSLRNDLQSRINSVGQPNSTGDQTLKEVLKPLLLNLVRTKGLKEGMLSWREVVLVVVRGIVKEIIQGFDSEDEASGPDGSQSEAKTAMIAQLRIMRHTDFVLLIQKVYRSLYNAVEGLQAQGAIIVEILTALSSEMQQKVTNIPAVEEDLTDIVSTTAELSNTQAAKVISYRAEQHAALDLADFLTFFNDSWSFVIKCETISRRMIVGLRGTVVGQAKLFLQAFHQARISQSAKLVEDEVWNPTEITPGLQHMTSIILDAAVRDPPELIIKTDDTIFSPYATTFPSGAPNGTSAVTPSFGTAMQTALPTAMPSAVNGVVPPKIGATGHPSTSSASTKHLRIEERSYYAVIATTEVLSLLLDYLRVVINLSMLTTDTMSRVIEFLKAFNSRTCQVVLGAGAMRSAGLKNITARHLALASQSLSIVFELIPYIREAFRRHLSQKQAVMLVEFDKLKRDFQEHQNEIHSKLIAIMGDRLNAHVKALKAVDWIAPQTTGGVNSYMEVLVKETVTLHKVLSRYLAANVVEYVMTQVFAAINHRLSEEYAAITLPNQDAKTRLLADAKYLHEKLAALKNVGSPTGMLETVVKEKRIGSNAEADAVGVSPANTPPAPIRSNTLTANQRLRGLMTGRRTSFNPDPALPHPTPSSTPPPPPPASDKPQSPIPPSQNMYGVSGSREQLGSGSQLTLPDGNPSGFREVAGRNSESRS
ncbi:Vps54-like protein-domain-containing protein [Crepidotus variabilis]|uniref:Vps54-like protein-domain-containing protein n=1 Tax=Crepidotus variabilis TaxID=179855 RepID=A0A9P6JTV0_9AGAR|nr:Vps54-like protein-domain-containing protein [Crepidotus variabilis]